MLFFCIAFCIGFFGVWVGRSESGCFRDDTDRCEGEFFRTKSGYHQECNSGKAKVGERCVFFIVGIIMKFIVRFSIPTCGIDIP